MSRPSPAYIEMIKAKLDAMNSANGTKGGKQSPDNFGMVDHYAQYRNDDHLDIMGRAAIDYMNKQREQDFGHLRS